MTGFSNFNACKNYVMVEILQDKYLILKYRPMHLYWLFLGIFICSHVPNIISYSNMQLCRCFLESILAEMFNFDIHKNSSFWVTFEETDKHDLKVKI